MTSKSIPEKLRRISPSLDILECEDVLQAADRIEALEEALADCIAGPRRSVKIINKSVPNYHPIQTTMTKGQTLNALRLLSDAKEQSDG